MEKLPFKNEELDLIWSEGAIYNIGFKRGLNEWHKLIKTGGYLAVSEASWFTKERPAEIDEFWQENRFDFDCKMHRMGKKFCNCVTTDRQPMLQTTPVRKTR